MKFHIININMESNFGKIRKYNVHRVLTGSVYTVYNWGCSTCFEFEIIPISLSLSQLITT